jgi:hypothetical protein
MPGWTFTTTIRSSSSRRDRQHGGETPSGEVA